MGPNSTRIFIKRRHLETGAVGESHVVMKAEITNRGMPEIASKPPETGGGVEQILLQALGRHSPC